MGNPAQDFPAAVPSGNLCGPGYPLQSFLFGISSHKKGFPLLSLLRSGVEVYRFQ